MRLLNIQTLDLEDFSGREIPRYCILSHRWGQDEVSYKEYCKGLKRDGAGYRKLVDFSAVVRQRLSHNEGIAWVWIDTCCIDKRSSSELSEAINSMYDWYNNAHECYVYMADVLQPPILDNSLDNFIMGMGASEWFRRGWTLQELLAPQRLVFFNATWEVLGHIDRRKPSFPRTRQVKVHPEDYGLPLQAYISDITGIPKAYLEGKKALIDASIAQRMSWASYRQTTRVEDEAYCLIGIFGINMPLLYGEGRKAFIRLQEEIIRRSTDQSILAWDQGVLTQYQCGVLAPAPRFFPIRSFEDEQCHLFHTPYTITNNGLEMRTRLSKGSIGRGPSGQVYLMNLNYSFTGKQPAYVLLTSTIGSGIYDRVFVDDFESRSVKWASVTDQVIYLQTGAELLGSGKKSQEFSMSYINRSKVSPPDSPSSSSERDARFDQSPSKAGIQSSVFAREEAQPKTRKRKPSAVLDQGVVQKVDIPQSKEPKTDANNETHPKKRKRRPSDVLDQRDSKRVVTAQSGKPNTGSDNAVETESKPGQAT